MEAAFAPIEAKYRSQVQAATWGHLAPKKNRTYKGRIVFAFGCLGDDHLNATVLFLEFKASGKPHEELDSSPWLYEHMIDFLNEQPHEGGCVYEFVGTFRNYEFKGQIRKVLDPNKK